MNKEVLVYVIQELWDAWEIRVLVILSLSLQIILVLFGSRRKKTPKISIKILVWSAYLSAEWVATFALGKLASTQGSSRLSQELQKFWAPFLLLHLGGPDTITAYSLEDNELWLRHFLQVVFQVGMAMYVLAKSWSSNVFTFLAIPMLINGVINYGERSWVLRSSSTERFRNSLISTRDPSPSLVRMNMKGDIERQEQDSNVLFVAHFLLKRFSFLFVGIFLSKKEAEKCHKILLRKSSAKEVFHLFSVELGLMYDLIFTKAITVYSRIGTILRCFHFVSLICALLVFSKVVFFHSYPLADVCTTYFLLLGAVFLEIYSCLCHFSSDWTKLICLIRKSKNAKRNIFDFMVHCPSLSTYQKWRSISMGQFNFISFCIKDIPTKCRFIYGMHEWLDKYQYSTWEDVNFADDNQFLQVIYKGVTDIFKMFAVGQFPNISVNEILERRGDHVYPRETEFDKSVLVWHIATEVMYYADLETYGEDKLDSTNCKTSRYLSNYMMYLLVFCPSMISNGTSDLRLQDACNELIDELKINVKKTKSQVLNCFQKAPLDIEPDPGKSVVANAKSLFCKLQNLETDETHYGKWEIVCEVWVELLRYAASHCGWKEHCQQLAKGGELLTYVSLLMAHHGLSTQFQEYGRDL